MGDHLDLTAHLKRQVVSHPSRLDPDPPDTVALVNADEPPLLDGISPMMGDGSPRSERGEELEVVLQISIRRVHLEDRAHNGRSDESRSEGAGRESKRDNEARISGVEASNPVPELDE